jgi:hypothetical protein
LRRKRGNGMFVHHLLTAFTINNDREVVKGTNKSSDLEPISQVYGYGNALFTQLVEEIVLDINGFIHQ